MSSNVWKLQDAKARLSEVIRRAGEGEPQIVTVRGEPAVTITSAKKSGSRKGTDDLTMAGFIERSKKYRGLGLKIPPRTKMPLTSRPSPFDEDEK
jgi:prevent-host-death family protein